MAKIKRTSRRKTTPRSAGTPDRYAARPGLKRPTPPMPSMARRGSARRVPDVGAKDEPVLQLPTSTDDVRARGLRYILTIKPGSAATGLETALHTSTRLKWQVDPMFENPSSPDLMRYHLATLPGVSNRDLEINAFDLADRIVAAAPKVIERAEPDLPQDVYEPSHDPENPMRFRGRRSGGDGDAPAPSNKDWHLELVRVPGVGSVPLIGGANPDGSGVVVGHPDTGYTDHASFGTNKFDLSRDRDFVEDDDDAKDPLNYRGNKGHGTKTGSVIAARGLPTARIGVAQGATIVPIRTIKSVIVVRNGDVARAIQHAVDNGCHVISMSLGGLGTEAMEAAVNYAVSKNVIVLAAAGNHVWWVVAPANYEQCIAVAACNDKKRPWSGSAHGKAVAITAPGESVWVAKPADLGQRQDELVPGSGTSFAVATTAGVAALWLQHHGRDNLLQHYAGRMTLQDAFRTLLKQTAQPVQNWDTSEYGPGILDALKLITAALPNPRRRVPGAVRRTTGPAPSATRTPVAQLATLYPDVDPAKVRATLSAMVRTRQGAAGSARVDLDRAAIEMLHILGSDPLAHREFRDAMEPRSSSDGGGRTARSLATRSSRAGDMIADKASESLARALLRS